ncbi:MAG TPA: hypothetical protein VHM28_09880, partial [Anaerolineales bacterium]|nr:hypothetical protein [Anaerolineales bacterium]
MTPRPFDRKIGTKLEHVFTANLNTTDTKVTKFKTFVYFVALVVKKFGVHMELGLVRKIDIDNEMQQAYLDYAMSTIV